MAADGARTLGEFLSHRRDRGEWVRVRMGVDQPSQGGDKADKSPYNFYPARTLLEEEFHRIWAAQAEFHPDVLTDARCEHLFRVMFHQRPLKPVRVGKCSFNPQEFRLAKAHPLFQLFRLYKEVNELAVVDDRKQQTR